MKERKCIEKEENNVKYIGGGVEKSSFREPKILYCKTLS